MTHLLRILLGLLVTIQYGQAQNVRYLDEVFSSVTVTNNIKYGRNLAFPGPFATPADSVDLNLDIYEPTGDTEQKRPVIILCHAGSFLSPQTIAVFSDLKPLGTRNDYWLAAACSAFAKRGYVVASIDYRVGWNVQAITQELRARSIMQAVWRGQQDFRAAVRYFRKNAAQLRIDVNKIAGGGSSSGAYLPIHAAMLNRPSELVLEKFIDEQGNSFIDTMALGRFEGNTGNEGYSSKIQAILSFGGAVGDTAAIEAGDPIIIAAHGLNDPSTPYKTATVFTSVGNVPIIEVSGSYDLVRKSKQLGNQQRLIDKGFNDSPFPGLLPFPDCGFEPYGWWDVSSPGRVDSGKVYLKNLINFVAPRLKAVMVDAPSGIDKHDDITLKNLNIYPNPVKNTLYVEFPAELGEIKQIEIFDLVGRQTFVKQYAHKSQNATIDVSMLSPGVYFVKVKTGTGEATKKIAVE